MAVPKRKTTPSKRDMRRAQHDKVTPVQVISCENCGEARLDTETRIRLTKAARAVGQYGPR